MRAPCVSLSHPNPLTPKPRTVIQDIRRYRRSLIQDKLPGIIRQSFSVAKFRIPKKCAATSVQKPNKCAADACVLHSTPKQVLPYPPSFLSFVDACGIGIKHESLPSCRQPMRLAGMRPMRGMLQASVTETWPQDVRERCAQDVTERCA